MKVLQINTVFKTGGSTGRIVYDLKCVMDGEGIDGYVAFGYGYNPTAEDDGRVYRIESDAELLVSKVSTKFIGHHGFDNKAETRRLLRWIDSIGPDVIHLHNIHNHYVNIGLLLGYIAERGIPCVFTMHDCWTFTGHCAYFDYSGCDKWKTGCHHCPSLWDYPRTFAPVDPSQWNYRHKRRLFAPLGVTFVCPSRWLAGLTAESFLKGKPCMVINNGVDTGVFKPCGDDAKQRLGIAGKRMILAMATGFVKRKGIDYLLQIPDMLTDDEVLVLVGMTPGQKRLLPPRRCIGIERTSDVTELAEYYSAADVFVNATLEDNFPTTNIEALACGTPVVTFATGGSTECVLDGEEPAACGTTLWTSVGAVVPQGDAGALLGAAREICRRGKAAWQSACRAKAEKRYDKRTQYLEYLNLYRDLCKKG